MCPLDPTQKKEEKLKETIAEGTETQEISKVEVPEAEKERLEPRPEEVEKVEEKKVEEMKEEEKEAAPPPAAAAPAPAPVDTELKDIQNVMQENIIELYSQMPPAEQKKFKEEGVRTAQNIKTLLGQVKVNVKKIVELLRRWLSRLPGINKYFLEQESKIKLDKLLAIKKEKEQGGLE